MLSAGIRPSAAGCFPRQPPPPAAAATRSSEEFDRLPWPHTPWQSVATAACGLTLVRAKARGADRQVGLCLSDRQPRADHAARHSTATPPRCGSAGVGARTQWSLPTTRRLLKMLITVSEFALREVCSISPRAAQRGARSKNHLQCETSQSSVRPLAQGKQTRARTVQGGKRAWPSWCSE